MRAMRLNAFVRVGRTSEGRLGLLAVAHRLGLIVDYLGFAVIPVAPCKRLGISNGLPNVSGQRDGERFAINRCRGRHRDNNRFGCWLDFSGRFPDGLAARWIILLSVAHTLHDAGPDTVR